MEIKKSDIVMSLNGRDTGKIFFVIGMENEYSILADGKCRRVEKPKRKKNKHLKLRERPDCRTAERIKNGEKVTNSEIRRALAEYEAGAVSAVDYAGHEAITECVKERAGEEGGM